jgi:pyrroline-5-carboxylate reductase
MLNKSVGFIGGGRVVKIILGSLKKADQMPLNILVSDSNSEALKKLKDLFPEIQTTQNNREPAKMDLVFFSLHPPVISDVLKEIKDSIKKESVFISLAPKVSISKLSDGLAGFKRIVRMIPNAPTIINEGYNPVYFSNSIPGIEKEELSEIFKIFGNCPEVNEENLEAYAILAAMGPTYLWFQLYELQEIGKSFGLTEKEIEDTILNMVTGAVKTMYTSNLSPSEVMDLVPVKPIGDEETNIKNIYQSKLIPLFKKLKS